jgi:hypothetical protein
VTIIWKSNRADIKKCPEISELVIFANITIMMMNFISFSIVKETNVRRRKKFLSEFDFEKEVTQLSEIEKIKLINSEPNRFSAGSKSWLLSEEFNGTEDKQTSCRQITQLLKFVVFPYMFIVFFFGHNLSYLLL